MKFIVENVACNGGRIGCLSGLRSQPEVHHRTPIALVSTLGGTAPHLTKDTLHIIINKDAPMCFPALHFVTHGSTLKKYDKGVAHFAALESHPCCITVQDAITRTPSGYNEKKGVSLWGSGGRIVLDSKKYMDLVEVMQPDWFEALHDGDTDESSSKKRVQKSLINSNSFIEKCISIINENKSLENSAVFLPLLGGHNVDDRERWSKSMKDHIDAGSTAIGGVSIMGLHTNGPISTKLKRNDLRSCIKASLGSIPSKLPRQVNGA